MVDYKAALENEKEKLERAIRKLDEEIDADGQPEGMVQVKKVQQFKLDFVNELMQHQDDPVQLRALITEKIQTTDATKHDALENHEGSAEEWWVTDEARIYTQALSNDMELFKVREDR